MDSGLERKVLNFLNNFTENKWKGIFFYHGLELLRKDIAHYQVKDCVGFHTIKLT